MADPRVGMVTELESDLPIPASSRGEMAAGSVMPVTEDGGGSQSSKGLSIRPLFKAVRRHPLLIMLITTGATTVAALLSGLSAPTYEGRFQLLVEPVTDVPSTEPQSISGLTEGKGGDRGLDYATQVQILRGSRLLSDISEQVQARYPQFGPFNLFRGLSIQRVGTDFTNASKILEVVYQGENPAEVLYVLEKTSERYLRYSLEERKTRISNGVKFIDEQLPSLRQRTNALQGQLQTLQEKYRVFNPQDQGEALFTSLRQFTSQQQEVQGQLLQQKKLYTRLQQQLKLTPDEAVAASALSDNPTYQKLQAQLKEVDQQIALASASLQPDNPRMQVLVEQRQNLARVVEQESQQVLRQEGKAIDRSKVLAFQNPLRQSLIKQLVDTGNSIQLLEIRNQELTQNRAAAQQQAAVFPSVTRQYTDLQQQLELANRTLNQLLTQRESLRVGAAQTEFPWEMIARPALIVDANGAPMPTYQKFMRNLLLGAAGGLFLGIAAALLLERNRNQFSTSDDIADATEMPLLGVLPFHKPLERLGNTSDTVLLNPDAEDRRLIEQSQFSAACDYLFTNLCFLQSGPPVRALAICSPEPGDGKSTVAVQLAQTAASMGQRVLLVDANWQNPQLHNYLNLPNLTGLGDVITNDTNKAVIQQVPGTENLFLLPFGQLPFPNGRPLASPRMMHLVEKLQTGFDLVIYDTPYLLASMETNFLAAQTDGVVLVISTGKTKRTLATQMVQQLKGFKIPCLGVVSNTTGETGSAKSRPPKDGGEEKLLAADQAPKQKQLTTL
jgi:polysaccharide biosynthesis transport protein